MKGGPGNRRRGQHSGASEGRPDCWEVPEPRPSRSPCRGTGATGGGGSLPPRGQSMEVCEEEESGQGRCSRASSGIGNWKETEKRGVLWGQQVVAAGRG